MSRGAMDSNCVCVPFDRRNRDSPDRAHLCVAAYRIAGMEFLPRPIRRALHACDRLHSRFSQP